MTMINNNSVVVFCIVTLIPVLIVSSFVLQPAVAEEECPDGFTAGTYSGGPYRGSIFCTGPGTLSCPSGFKVGNAMNRNVDSIECVAEPSVCSGTTIVPHMFDKGYCVIGSPSPIKCPSGTTPIAGGLCTSPIRCTDGFSDNLGGKCIETPPSTCPPGLNKAGEGVAATCSKQATLSCPDGAKVAGLACEGTISCPPDTSIFGGVCYGKNLGTDCPKGNDYYETAGVCWSKTYDSPGSGWNGSVWSWHRASSTSCSGGTWDGSTCIAGSPSCSQGTTWNQSTCYATPSITCPEGLRESGARCYGNLHPNCPTGSTLSLGVCEKDPTCDAGGWIVTTDLDKVTATSCNYKQVNDPCSKGNLELGYCTTSRCPNSNFGVDIHSNPTCWKNTSFDCPVGYHGEWGEDLKPECTNYQFPFRSYDAFEEPEEILVDKKIPEWVNNTMQWYLDGVISEDEMISAIQFLIKEGLIKVN